MQDKSIVSNNISAELHESWHIPRPTLARSSQGSLGSTASNNSTQSVKSGSLLLTAANLAKIHKQETKVGNRDSNLQYYLQQVNDNQLTIDIDPKKLDADNVSIASSTHFTVVNVNTRPQIKSRGFCRKHQLSVLVISMSILFTIGVLAAIVCLEMRARRQAY